MEIPLRKNSNWKILETELARQPHLEKMKRVFWKISQRFSTPSSHISSIKMGKRGGGMHENFIIHREYFKILPFFSLHQIFSFEKWRHCIAQKRADLIAINHAGYHESFVDRNVGGNCQTSGTWKFLIDRRGGREGGRRPGKKDDLTSSDEIKHDRTL